MNKCTLKQKSVLYFRKIKIYAVIEIIFNTSSPNMKVHKLRKRNIMRCKENPSLPNLG